MLKVKARLRREESKEKAFASSCVSLSCKVREGRDMIPIRRIRNERWEGCGMGGKWGKMENSPSI